MLKKSAYDIFFDQRLCWKLDGFEVMNNFSNCKIMHWQMFVSFKEILLRCDDKICKFSDSSLLPAHITFLLIK